LRDGTARNWQRKRDIFQRSRLWIATDSEWLLNKVRASMLNYVDARTIYPGTDLEIFKAGDRQHARTELGLPQDTKILLFVAYNARHNPLKNYPLLKQVIKRVRAQVGDKVILLVVGNVGLNKLVIEDGIWHVPPIETAQQLAHYYRAADIYVHATHVETFGLTTVEAMATGIPVVATRTAAIPEVVADGESGFLTSPGDVEEMSARVIEMLGDTELRQAMGLCALQASKRFSLQKTIAAYLDWYEEILAQVAMQERTKLTRSQ
jgi:glycosyltransferase involved in cell wall biosynthesis